MQGWLGTMTSFRKSYLRGSDHLTNRPLRRRFLRYDLEVTESNLELVDRYEEQEPLSGQYIAKESRAKLDELSTESRDRLISNLQVRQLLAAVLSSLRKEIDQDGLKIFFDPQVDGTLRPKWRYRCRGRWQTDPIQIEEHTELDDPYFGDPNIMPVPILELVTQDNTTIKLPLGVPGSDGRCNAKESK